jgi:hypothetical protein
MVIMKLIRPFFLTGLIVFVAAPTTRAANGLATRDLNPVLQPIFLPRYRNPGNENGWSVDHSFFVTNTLQKESRSDESLIIDVENYQYNLDFALRSDAWVFQTSLPITANRSGELDGTIDTWHDLFGLPQANRPDFPQDQLQIEYIVDGETRYSQKDGSDGIGDIALQAGYFPTAQTGYFAGLELPTGSESDFSGNEAVDIALWMTKEWEIDSEVATYGLLGISFPGDGGALEGLVEDYIWVAQLGLEYRFHDAIKGLAQLDFHSQWVNSSDLKAFGNSLQLQLGLSFENLIQNHRLDLFFSEDIQVESAPDITFGMRLAQKF